MGVVIKQSFWGSAFAYIGVILGFLNTIVLRPAYLDMGEIGLFTLVISNALLFAPFVNLGMPGTYLRYFPYLQPDKKLHDQFFTFQVFTLVLANILLGVFALIFIDWIKGFYKDDSTIYHQYISISFLILVLYSFFLQLHAFSRVKMDVILPNALKEVFLRVGNILLIILYAFDWVSFEWMIYLLIVNYLIPVIILFIQLKAKHHLHLTWSFLKVPKLWLKKMFWFGGYNLLLAGSNSIASNISFLMIPAMLSMDQNGIYSICFYIGIIIEMPKRAMVQVISPIVSGHFKNRDLKGINDLYKKVSQTLSVIAMLFFIGVLCNITDLFALIPQGDTLSSGIYVVLAIAVAKIVDLAFSFNSEILVYSEYYKTNLYYFLLTALIMFLLNLWLIPILGINGAALGFLISTALFNLAKYIFLKVKFNLSPFTVKHFTLIGVSGAIILIFWYLPLTAHALLNILIRSALITITYGFIVFKLKISTDINNLSRSLFKKYLKVNI